MCQVHIVPIKPLSLHQLGYKIYPVFADMRKMYIGQIFDQIVYMTFLSRVTLHVAFRRMPELEKYIQLVNHR